MKSRSGRPRQTKGGVHMPSAFRARKGKLSGGIIAMSAAAIISVYTLGRANSSAVSNQFVVRPPTTATVVAPIVPTVAPADGGALPTATSAAAQGTGSTAAAPATAAQPTSTPVATYKDGSYTGTGNSRHGGMKVALVVANGRITSANVVACSTRYSCSDVDPLVSETVSTQSVPVHYISGATDSSDAYYEAVSSAIAQAKA